MNPTTRRRSIWAAIAVLAAAGLLAGCTSSPSSSSSALGTSPTKTPIAGGAVTFAESPGAAPNYIFPMDALQYFSTSNLAQFQYLMWRPLYWVGDGAKVVVNDKLSLANAPVYSQNNTVVTINLKPYKWSDGQLVTSRDVTFWINLLKANKTNWGEYAPGFFPDDVKDVKATSATQLVLTLDGPVNPDWFTQSELTQVIPIPQHAWDKTSESGPIKDYDATTAGAIAVYKFLDGQSKQVTTYASNPLWRVIDGPWTLTKFDPSGLAEFSKNLAYSGSVKPQIDTFTEVPFTSEAAEYNALRAGQLTYGYIPPSNIAQKALIQAQGYLVDPWYLWSMNIIPINFNNPQIGPVLRQLYVRQAMQELINQPQYVAAILKGNGAVDNGPVPTLPDTQYLTDTLRHGAYPFNPTAAVALLKAHGWTVRPNGVSTCTSPGQGLTQCGAGVAAGTPLTLPLVYASGLPEARQEMSAFKSDLALAGITLVLAQKPQSDIFSTITPCAPTASACKWQAAYWGNGWEFAPDYYPSGEVAFSTGAIGNWGSYSNPVMDAMIKATTTSVGLDVFHAWADYTAQQLPMLFMPIAASQISAIKSTLQGTTPQPSAGLAITPESWYFTK
jgi:peptide/nickel transport system substrate-binding protein